jgi:hypothetical protein
MNFKKLGIVLFLLIAVAGFSLSSVNANDDTTIKDIVDHNKMYIPQELNLLQEHAYDSDLAWDNLMNNYWYIKLKSDKDKTFISGTNLKDSRGNLLRSNVAYIPNHAGYWDQEYIYTDDGSYDHYFHYIIDCRDTGIKYITFSTLREATITGSLDKNITNVTYIQKDFDVSGVIINNNNFQFKIKKEFDFYGSESITRITPITFTFEDGTTQTVNVDVHKFDYDPIR